MSSDSLKGYYTRMYTGEGAGPGVDALPLRSPRPSTRHEAALSFVPDRLPMNADVLEFGAGNGDIAHSLKVGGVPFASYTIGDVSPPRVEGLRRTFDDPRFRIVEADAEHASRTIEGTFDAVLMVALIEHLVDPVAAMTDIHGLLKPNGFVYIDTPNIAKWTRRVKLALGQFPSTASTNEGLTTYDGEPSELYDEGHLHYFTYRSLGLMLTERCGFSRVEGLGYYPDQRLPALGHRLTALRPKLFSEVAMLAFA